MLDELKNYFSKEKKEDAKADGAIPAVLGVTADVILKIKKDLYEFGRERALSSGTTDFDEEEAISLAAHAEAMAREQTSVLFDAANSRHDAEIEEQLQVTKELLREAEADVAEAKKKVVICRDGLANRGRAPVEPAVPVLLIALFGLAIAASMIPAFLDFIFFSFKDRRLATVLSVASSVILGYAIAVGIAASFRSSHRAPEIVGLAGGLLLGVAFLLIRLAGVHDLGGLLFSLGLFALEVGSIVILEIHGLGLRREYREFKPEMRDWEAAFDRLKSAETELSDRLADKAKFESRTAAFVQHIREREHLARQLVNLVNGARQAVLDGYRAGLAVNLGQIRGRRIRRDKVPA